MDFMLFRGPTSESSTEDTSQLGHRFALYMESMAYACKMDDEAAPLVATFQLNSTTKAFYDVHFWARRASKQLPFGTLTDPQVFLPQGRLTIHLCLEEYDGKVHNQPSAEKVAIMNSLFMFLPLHRIREIEIIGIPTHAVFSSSRLWYLWIISQCVYHMRAAQVITLRRWNVHWLRQLLEMDEEEAGFIEDCSVLLCDQLKTLVLEEMALGSVWSKRSHAYTTRCQSDEEELQGRGGMESIFRENNTEVLTTVLRKWEKKRGKPLEGVVLRDCYGMTEEAMQSLNLGSASVQVVSS